MLSIDAKRRHRVAANMMPTNYPKSDNNWFLAAFMPAVILGIIGFLFFVVNMVMGFQTDLSVGPTPILWAPMLISSAALTTFAYGTHHLGRVKKLDYRLHNTEIATGLYSELLPHHQKIAEPIVRKIQELEEAGNASAAIEERNRVLRKISDQDQKDRKKAVVVKSEDRSDLIAAENYLTGMKELT